MFKVTKTFLTGPLAGMTITETTSVMFEAGKVYRQCAGGGSYRVRSVERVVEPATS
jgi:hypothetical protein